MEIEMVHTTGSPGRHDSDSEPSYSERKRQMKSTSEMALHRKQSRRCKKQMSERQRRKRMNNSMDKLGLLVYGKTFQDGLKVDKATLLKDAYEKLQMVKDDYHKGYETAITSTRSFLDSLQSCPQEVKDALNRHLNNTMLLNMQRSQSSASATFAMGTGAESSSDSCSPQPVVRSAADSSLEGRGLNSRAALSLTSSRGGSRKLFASPAPSDANNDLLLQHQHQHHLSHQGPHQGLSTTSPVSEESPEKHHPHYYHHSPAPRHTLHSSSHRVCLPSVHRTDKLSLKEEPGVMKVEAVDPKLGSSSYALLAADVASSLAMEGSAPAPARRTVVQLAPSSGAERAAVKPDVAKVSQVESTLTSSISRTPPSSIPASSSSALPFAYSHPAWSFGESLQTDSPASLRKSLHSHPINMLNAAAYPPQASYPFAYAQPSSSPSSPTAQKISAYVTPYVTSFAPQKPLYLSPSPSDLAGYRMSVYAGATPPYPALTPLSARTPAARSVAAATATATAAGAPSKADDSGYVSPGVPSSPYQPPKGGAGYGSIKKRYLQELARQAAGGVQSSESDEENDREVERAFKARSEPSSHHHWAAPTTTVHSE